MVVPHIKKNPLTNGQKSEIKRNDFREIEEQFGKKQSTIISNELKSDTINSFYRIPLLD